MEKTGFLGCCPVAGFCLVHPGKHLPWTPSAAACVFIAALSLRMMARQSWHREDRSLQEGLAVSSKLQEEGPK